MKKTKVVLTGGHGGTTALATVEEIKKMNLGWEIHWVGVKKAFEGSPSLSLEFKLFPNLGVKCHALVTGRLQRKFTPHTVPSVLKIPIGMVHALYLLLKIRPQIVVSYGGFAAFPTVTAAYLLRIPIVLHEQTVAVGLANKVSAPFAKTIAIAREESKKYFPAKKTVLVGNPVSQEFAKINPKKDIGNPPVILVICGSRGSQIINNVLSQALPSLIPEFEIIHITGDAGFKKFEPLKNKSYTPISFVSYSSMPSFYKKADIVVARGGANTISEILSTGRPAVIIPIPWTRYDEQGKNAKMVEDMGLGTVLKQKDLSPQSLIDKIKFVQKNWAKMSRAGNSEVVKRDESAAAKLLEIIKNEISS